MYSGSYRIVTLLQVARVWLYRYRKLSYFNFCLSFNLGWGILRS